MSGCFNALSSRKGYEVTVLDLMIYGEEVLTKNKNLKLLKAIFAIKIS